MNHYLQNLRDYLADRFNLKDDEAEEASITNDIRKNVEFKGSNLWTLIFAIFIASIGLNVNSTAVIIGAMLISPIMGPIMGIGLGTGISDLTLVKTSARNLLIATLIGIVTSAIYFRITPLHQAQSELLARTSPSIWDVFIAFFGGLAGMVASSRKEKTNVIPGVAIATALMPPLCTAGYGWATGNWYYVLGALYLYFINSVFIAIATYLMARYLKIKKFQFEDAGTEKKVTRFILIIVIVTITPSIYMAYKIVDKNIFENNAENFIDQQFKFPNTQVVTKSFIYNKPDKSINVLLFGDRLSAAKIDSLKSNMHNYDLKDVKLSIIQGLNARKQIDLAQIKTSILQQVYASQAQKDTTPKTKPDTIRISRKIVSPDSAVLTELKVLYPAIRYFGVNRMIIRQAGTLKSDTMRFAVAGFKHPLSKAETGKMQAWLRARYQAVSLKLIVE